MKVLPRRGGGTFVPARSMDLVPILQTQSLKETIRHLVELLNHVSGEHWRLTRLDVPTGQCADCGEYVQGDTCPNCGTAARSRA